MSRENNGNAAAPLGARFVTVLTVANVDGLARFDLKSIAQASESRRMRFQPVDRCVERRSDRVGRQFERGQLFGGGVIAEDPCFNAAGLQSREKFFEPWGAALRQVAQRTPQEPVVGNAADFCRIDFQFIRSPSVLGLSQGCFLALVVFFPQAAEGGENFGFANSKWMGQAPENEFPGHDSAKLGLVVQRAVHIEKDGFVSGPVELRNHSSLNVSETSLWSSGISTIKRMPMRRVMSST